MIVDDQEVDQADKDTQAGYKEAIDLVCWRDLLCPAEILNIEESCVVSALRRC
jgi:hypothetical protein